MCDERTLGSLQVNIRKIIYRRDWIMSRQHFLNFLVLPQTHGSLGLGKRWLATGNECICYLSIFLISESCYHGQEAQIARWNDFKGSAKSSPKPMFVVSLRDALFLKNIGEKAHGGQHQRVANVIQRVPGSSLLVLSSAGIALLSSGTSNFNRCLRSSTSSVIDHEIELFLKVL